MTAGTLAAGTLATGLFGTFAEFVDELRGAGVPVSTTEVLDATEALRHLPLEDREALKLGLAAALVKEEGHWRTYETLFELYFSLRGRGLAELSGAPVGELGEADNETELTASELAELAYKALMDGDPELMAALARAAVSRFAGMEPGRPVGGSYYVFKTLRQLQADALLNRLLNSLDEVEGLEGLTLANDYRRRFERMREEVEAEVRRRLVADRGAKVVARATRRPLPEDVDFMHLGKDELAALQRTVQPFSAETSGPPGAKTPGTERRAARFSCHHATFSVEWRRPRRTPFQGPAPLQTGTVGIGGYLRLCSRVRPLHAPARICTVVPVFAHTFVGFCRRHRRSDGFSQR